MERSTDTTQSKKTVYLMVTYAIFTALICIFAPMSIPIGPIPISLTNLVLYISLFIIYTRGSLVSYTVYLLLGIAGLPVFSGYVGGLAKLAGPTGGYLIGFYPMLIIAGITFRSTLKLNKKLHLGLTFLSLVIGTLVAYAFGTVWFVLQMECTCEYALSVCVIPFIPFDLIKIIIAMILGEAVRKPLLKQGLIER